MSSGMASFHLWQSSIKDILVHQGLLTALQEKKPESMEDEDWRILQARAVNIILNSGPEFKNSILMSELKNSMKNNMIMNETSPYALWKKLEKIYKSNYGRKKIYLKKKFYELKMIEDADVWDHIIKFNKCIARLLSIDVNIEEEDKVLILLASLPKSYEKLVTTLLVEKATLTVDKVSIALLENEDSRSNANVYSMDSWILDSCAGVHVCPYKECFDTYKPCDGGTIVVADGSRSKIIGIGTVKVKMFDGVVRTLTNVRHVPEVLFSIISLGILDNMGYDYSVKNGVMIVNKGASVAMRGQKISNLYKLVGKTILGGCISGATP